MNLQNKTTERFYDLCKKNLFVSEDFFCPFCGEAKKEFLSPLTGRSVLLDCICEREYKNFCAVYASYRKAKLAKMTYAELIDGKCRLANEDENQILECGVKMRDQILHAQKLLLIKGATI